MLLRHGQTEWSATGRHTSYTDVDLTEEGERQATALAKALDGQAFAAVVASPRTRALRTAVLAGLDVSIVDEDLAEWHYGEYEGMTTPQIRQGRPGWSLWTDGCPGGESPEQVGERADRVLARVAARLASDNLDGGNVALIGHGHGLRVVAARWIGLPPWAGGLLRLDTGTLSRLGHERERQVIVSWNCSV